MKSSCLHPVCKKGSDNLPAWFNGGPSIAYLPLPIPNPEKAYGGDCCNECKGDCCGHFMKPLEALHTDVLPILKPPSAILKEYFDKYNEASLTPAVIEEARKVLAPAEVKMWFNHLASVATIRKNAGKKVAQTRKQKAKEKSATLQYSCVFVMMCTKSTHQRWRTGFVVMVVLNVYSKLIRIPSCVCVCVCVCVRVCSYNLWFVT